MRIKIDDGIYLNVVQTKQFKTTQVSVQFLAPLDRATIGARTLLTSLLETSSAAYPEQNLLSAKLESLYGADFGIGVARTGRIHRVTAEMQVLADQYSDRPLLTDTFDFLREILLNPKITAGSFDSDTFDREKLNLQTYMASMNDDRGTQASLALQRTYFDDPAQTVPSFGTAADMDGVTASSLVATYQDMMANDQIEIVVLGDVDPATVEAGVRQMALPARPEHAFAVSYDQPVHGGVRLFAETEHVQQSKLNLAYHILSDQFGPQYYATVLAIELFGGSPLSLLFRNVREKRSMAYYASAGANMNRNFMVVQTGIDGVNRAEVERLIGEQLEMVRTGHFDDSQFDDIKTGLLSDRRSALDSVHYLKDIAVMSALYPDADLSPENEIKRIEAVTREDVQHAASAMTLQAVYFLKGDAE